MTKNASGLKFQIGDKVWVRTLFMDSNTRIQAGIISGYIITRRLKTYKVILMNDFTLGSLYNDIHSISIEDDILNNTTFFNEQTFNENNIFINEYEAKEYKIAEDN